MSLLTGLETISGKQCFYSYNTSIQVVIQLLPDGHAILSKCQAFHIESSVTDSPKRPNEHLGEMKGKRIWNGKAACMEARLPNTKEHKEIKGRHCARLHDAPAEGCCW